MHYITYNCPSTKQW